MSRKQPMINKGYRQFRFKDNPDEEVFANEWERQNTDRCGKQDGRGVLDYLLTDGWDNPNGKVTERDRAVAATVIQWLGSPVGKYFVRDCQKRCKR